MASVYCSFYQKKIQVYIKLIYKYLSFFPFICSQIVFIFLKNNNMCRNTHYCDDPTVYSNSFGITQKSAFCALFLFCFLTLSFPISYEHVNQMSSKMWSQVKEGNRKNKPRNDNLINKKGKKFIATFFILCATNDDHVHFENWFLFA